MRRVSHIILRKTPGQIAILIALSVFSGQYEIHAASNPLALIRADQFDGKSAGVKTEDCTLGGRDICSIHNGDYVLYKAFDFDSGVAGFKGMVATKNDGRIEIRLDSLTGPLMGSCRFAKTGDWQNWQEILCPVDNSQAGVRDIYLVFRGSSSKALVNVSTFQFLKSLPTHSLESLAALSNRVDSVDAEPQAAGAWGMPEAGLHDDFQNEKLAHWVVQGMTRMAGGVSQSPCLMAEDTNLSLAYTPGAYINKTDTGGEWRTMAEASLAAEITLDSARAQPGIGFVSKDLKQGICVVMDADKNAVEVRRKLAESSWTPLKIYALATRSNSPSVRLKVGMKYVLKIDWSPYSDGLIIFLNEAAGTEIANFRAAVDLPRARHPLLISSGGAARFENVFFDPTLDSWNLKWEWYKTPVLTPDVCNPAVWKWKDGKYYMIWRKFGQDTYHGVASSSDGIHWDRLNDQILKCTGDMNVVVDPFGDGLVYVTPGGGNMPWFAADGAHHFTTWKDTGLRVGGILGNSRIQEIIDTKQYRQLQPVRLNQVDYRFIGFTENWTDSPKPHTVVLLSNTLTNWVAAGSEPVIPPRADFWGEKGSAVGAAFVLPDGNILLASCSCTFAGYTGAPEPSNVSVVVDGKQPWKILRLGILPDAPVSRENVWYQGPNFGTAFCYDEPADTLYFYGGFHDYNIGMMRVRHFSKSAMFVKSKSGLTANNFNRNE